jgi:hypothetical protein
MNRGQGDRCQDQQQRPPQNGDCKAEERRKTNGGKEDWSDHYRGERNH